MSDLNEVVFFQLKTLAFLILVSIFEMVSQLNIAFTAIMPSLNGLLVCSYIFYTGLKIYQAYKHKNEK